MKLEINKAGSSEFYDEFLYVYSNYRKYKKNPYKKAHLLTKYLIYYDLLVLIFIIMLSYLSTLEQDIFCMLLIGMLVLIFLFTTFYLIIIKKRINEMIKNHSQTIITFSEEQVSFQDDSKELKIKWQDIEWIIVNNYSICMIPKAFNGVLLSISIDYQEEVLKSINKYKKNNLLINNHHL